MSTAHGENDSPTKKCPYCETLVSSTAMKCPNCAEWFSQTPRGVEPMVVVQSPVAPPQVPPAVHTPIQHFPQQQQESVAFAVITLILYILFFPLGILLNLIGIFSGPKRGCFGAMLCLFILLPIIIVLIMIGLGMNVGIDLSGDIDVIKDRFFK